MIWHVGEQSDILRENNLLQHYPGRVLHRVLFVTSGAISSLKFRIWHDFRMQLPALVAGRNNTPEGCAASQRDLVSPEKRAGRSS